MGMTSHLVSCTKELCLRTTNIGLDTRRGELLLGFYLRASASIEGLEILTSLGRRSGIYGSTRAGTGHTLIAPRGYNIVGISGTCGKRIDGFSLLISR